MCSQAFLLARFSDNGLNNIKHLYTTGGQQETALIALRNLVTVIYSLLSGIVLSFKPWSHQ